MPEADSTLLDALVKILAALGFDPKLLGHAVASIPLFGVLMVVVRKADFVAIRYEPFVAVAILAVLDVAASVASGVQVFPAVSTACVGAVIAWIWHHWKSNRNRVDRGGDPDA